MIKYIFATVTLTHGLIHLMGFAKAFNYAEISQLTQPISKNTGWLWLSCRLTEKPFGIIPMDYSLTENFT